MSIVTYLPAAIGWGTAIALAFAYTKLHRTVQGLKFELSETHDELDLVRKTIERLIEGR